MKTAVVARFTPSALPLPFPTRFQSSSTHINFNTRITKTFFSSSASLSCLRPPQHHRHFTSIIPMASSSSPSTQSTEKTVESAGEDMFQKIRAHQEAAIRLSPIEEVRTIVDNHLRGMLSTISLEHEGYPSGSMVDFACDHEGCPILAVSSLAVHAKNLMVNPRCSLLVARDPEDRTDITITIYGDAIPVSDRDKDALRSTYLKRHPNAFWVDFGDFSFIIVKPKFVRYVSGVATTFLGSGEFRGEEYKAAKVDPISQFSNPIASHMNRDHAEDTKAIVQHSLSVKVDSAYMLDVDSLGFNVKGTLEATNSVPRRAQDRKDVKTLIVEMLQAARASN